MKNDFLREHLSKYVSVCKSPIESMLATALLYAIGLDMFDRAQDEKVEPICSVDFQVQVCSYRVDIVLKAPDILVAIECDGHEFHEKTKEQAARDKKRDRAITAAGYAVLRFSGSEIWRNPFQCADEALMVAKDQQARAAELAYIAWKSAQPKVPS